MAQTVIAVFVAAIVGVVLMAGAYGIQKRIQMPVTFKNLSEERAVCEAAFWAAKQMNIKLGDPRLRYSLQLPAYTYGYNWMGSIPVEELVLLSPFIDLIIDGKGPRLNMPPEYDQEEYLGPSRETLKQFKKRMQAEGLWPQPQS